MTWTYSSTSIGTDLAKIRLTLGDTNSNDPLLTDEEIAYYQTLDTDLRLVAARCCDAIVGKLARNIDRSNLGMSAQRSQVVQHYLDLADRLRKEARNSAASPTTAPEDAGAPDQSYADDLQSSDRPNLFYRGMNDNPGSGSGDGDDC